MSAKTREIEVLDTSVKISRFEEEDFLSLTDIARHRDSDRTDDLIRNWIRNRNTIEFLGIWEKIHNSGFNPVEFDGFRMAAGTEQLHDDAQAVDRAYRGERHCF